MASRDSWIDPREMEELAGQLGGAPRFPEIGNMEPDLPDPAREDTGPIPLMPDEPSQAYPRSGESSATPDVIAQLDRKLAEIKALAERSGLLMDRHAAPGDADPSPAPTGTPAAPEPTATPDVFYRPSGSLKQRLSALRIWLSQFAIPMRAFAVNAVGDPLMPGSPGDGRTEARLIAAALGLFDALRSHRVRRCSHSGSATVEIGDAGLLTIFPTSAHGADYLLCVVTGVPIPPESSRAIAKAFAAAL